MATKPRDEWFVAFVLSALMFAASWALYDKLDEFQASGETIKIHAVVALMYKIGGKWLPTGFFALAGVVLAYCGVRIFIGKKIWPGGK